MRVDRTRLVEAPVSSLWEAIADWEAHAEWQPSLAEVEAPAVIEAGARLTEVRASHGQRLTFDVVISEWEPHRRVRAGGKSRGVVSVAADLVYELEPQGDATAVTMALEAELPFVLVPLRHAVTIEVGKELEATLELLAQRQERAEKAS